MLDHVEIAANTLLEMAFADKKAPTVGDIHLQTVLAQYLHLKKWKKPLFCDALLKGPEYPVIISLLERSMALWGEQSVFDKVQVHPYPVLCIKNDKFVIRHIEKANSWSLEYKTLQEVYEICSKNNGKYHHIAKILTKDQSAWAITDSGRMIMHRHIIENPLRSKEPC